jgi:putative DNA primase/helicase
VIGINLRKKGATMRIYIDLPYSEKDRAKKILEKDLKYDFHSKCAFVESSEKHDMIKHILTSAEEDVKGKVRYTQDPQIEFKAFLESQGLVIEGLPLMDGAKHRASVAGKGSKNRSGEYKGYLDGRPSGFVRNYITDVYESWTFTGKIDESLKMSKAEIAQKKYERFIEEEGDFREISKKAKALWEGINIEEVAQEHAYLTRKGVKIHGARVNENNLVVIPLRNSSYKITNLQFISEDGAKNFLSGGRNKGSFFQIGYINERSTIIFVKALRPVQL